MMHCFLRSAALLCLSTRCTAFVLAPGDGTSLVRWSSPSNVMSSDGLGRGVAFVIDPALCDVLIPSLADAGNRFWSIGCGDVKNTIRRAFATWAANSPHVSFFDAGSLCEGSSGVDCAAAEVYVRAQFVTASQQALPKVQVELQTTSDPPRSTAPDAASRTGLPVHQRKITKAIITLLVEPQKKGWYLDASVCNGLLRQTFDVITLTYVISILCIIAGIAWVARLSLRLFNSAEKRDACACFHGALAALERVWELISILILLIIPATVLFGFFEPCFANNPVEPALLHAVGTALGLGNVSAPGLVQMALERGNATCSSNYTLVTNTSFDAFTSGSSTCTPSSWWTCDNRHASVMLAVNPTHTLTALTQDDLDALNVLYPSAACNSTRVYAPLQVPTASWYAGWTLLATCVLPLALLAFFLPPCAACARCMHNGCSPVADERAMRSGRIDEGGTDDFEDLDAKPSGRAYRM